MIQHHNDNPAAPSRAVVLGSSGFVGRGVMGELAAQSIPALGFTSAQLDLCEESAAEKLAAAIQPDDALVIVSALTPDKGRDIRTLMRNLAMIEHVCGALEKAAPAHIVYIGSDAIYHDDANPVREDSCASPGSYHGVMHLARERFLDVTLKGKTPLLHLRPTVIYGYGDTHNGYGPNRFLRTAMSDGKIALFGNGEEQRDHLYIDDLSRLVGQCLLHRTSGALNVASGKAHSFMEVATIVRDLVGEVAIETSPRQNPITHRHFDIAMLWSAFPSFQTTSLPSGLQATYAKMKEGQA